MVVKNLEFFDKDGYNLNLNWNDDRHIWEGNIFFPRVSVGLYENTTIYVVEYKGQQDNDYTDDEYTYPMGEGNIAFQWDLANSFVDEFFMFDFDEDYELKDNLPRGKAAWLLLLVSVIICILTGSGIWATYYYFENPQMFRDFVGEHYIWGVLIMFFMFVAGKRMCYNLNKDTSNGFLQ